MVPGGKKTLALFLGLVGTLMASSAAATTQSVVTRSSTRRAAQQHGDDWSGEVPDGTGVAVAAADPKYYPQEVNVNAQDEIEVTGIDGVTRKRYMIFTETSAPKDANETVLGVFDGSVIGADSSKSFKLTVRTYTPAELAKFKKDCKAKGITCKEQLDKVLYSPTKTKTRGRDLAGTDKSSDWAEVSKQLALGNNTLQLPKATAGAITLLSSGLNADVAGIPASVVAGMCTAIATGNCADADPYQSGTDMYSVARDALGSLLSSFGIKVLQVFYNKPSVIPFGQGNEIPHLISSQAFILSALQNLKDQPAQVVAMPLRGTILPQVEAALKEAAKKHLFVAPADVLRVGGRTVSDAVKDVGGLVVQAINRNGTESADVMLGADRSTNIYSGYWPMLIATDEAQRSPSTIATTVVGSIATAFKSAYPYLSPSELSATILAATTDYMGRNIAQMPQVGSKPVLFTQSPTAATKRPKHRGLTSVDEEGLGKVFDTALKGRAAQTIDAKILLGSVAVVSALLASGLYCCAVAKQDRNGKVELMTDPEAGVVLAGAVAQAVKEELKGRKEIRPADLKATIMSVLKEQLWQTEKPKSGRGRSLSAPG